MLCCAGPMGDEGKRGLQPIEKIRGFFHILYIRLDEKNGTWFFMHPSYEQRPKNNQVNRMLIRKFCLVCTQIILIQFAKPNWVSKGGELDIYCIVLTLYKRCIVHKQ